VLFATAFASSVFPVPGSPYRITPCGCGRQRNGNNAAASSPPQSCFAVQEYAY
jgi:hypothetical protein